MLDRLLHLVGFGLCHQLPERSFFGGGVQVPVCARDVGIYVGFLVSASIISALGGRKASEPPSARVLVLSAVFFGVMVVDGVTSYAGFRQTTNDIRLITGLLAGFAIPVLLMPMLNGQLWRTGSSARALDGNGHMLIWLAAVPAAFVLVRWVAPILGVFYPVLVVLAVLATFVLVNLALVSVLPPFERRALTFGDLAIPVALAFMLTLVELAGSSALKAAVLGVLLP